MAIETLREEALSLFNGTIDYALGDLSILDKIQSPDYSFTCAVPTAMLILGSLDFIGYILRDDAKKRDTEDNIRYAIRHEGYFPNSYTDEAITTLITHYRHGIMHSFMPANKGNARHEIYKGNGKNLFDVHGEKKVTVKVLNVNVLSMDFKEYIQKLKKHLEETTDASILQNIVNSIETTYTSSLNDNTTSSTTTTATTSSFYQTQNKR